MMTSCLSTAVAAVCALGVSTLGCGKPSSGGAASASASASATTAPAVTSAAASNLPVKPPFEAVKITYLDKKDPKDNSPLFKMENLGGKTVKVCFIDFYGYDDKGKQVAKQDLSWNGELKGGASDQIYTKDFKDAKTWEAVYHGIKFDGDDKIQMEPKRSPDKRPKGG